MVSHRSTKGASKARRDHINHEIRIMRTLLPIGRDDQERLSYLHSMAAICTFIRKSVLLQGLSAAADTSHRSPPYQAFLPALHGFVLVTTPQGRLVYVSENVSEYLGLSMLDVLQGDTVYDMVDPEDVDVLRSNLDVENESSPERSFVCRMHTSKAFKLQHGGAGGVLVRGRFCSFPHPGPPPSSVAPPPPTQPLFVALCTPTVDRLQSSDSSFCLGFDSVHRADMTFTQLSDSVSDVLGYSSAELCGRSWYSLVHPEDLSLCADSHTSLMHADEGLRVEMVLRLQSKDLSWPWIYIQANKLSQGMSCTNVIISETEARFLQKRISGEAFRPSASCHFAAQHAPQTHSGAKCFKRRRTSDSQSEGQSARAPRESDSDAHFVARAASRGDSSPAPSGDSLALFTPPYSPASSSCSSLQQEELSRDLLMDVHGYTDQLLSSPECSFPEAAFTCDRSPPSAFEQAAFIALTPLSSSSSSSSSSPTFDFQTCASDVRLVPDCLSVSEMCESSVDCVFHQEDLGLLQQPQGGSNVHVQHVPQPVLPMHSSLLTPNQSPSCSELSEREQAEISILAQQISSLASSFAACHSLNPLQNTAEPATTCDWPPPAAPLPLKNVQDLDDCLFESILKDLTAANPGFVSPGFQPALLCSEREEELLPVSSPPSLHEELLPVSSPPSLHEELLPVSPPSLHEELLPAETFMDPFSLQLGRHDTNTELHQLNRYMQRVLQQDSLAEENLY